MHTRLWLASAATVAVVATGAALVASPTLHGQTGTPAAPRDTDTASAPDAGDLGREIDDAVRKALDNAGIGHGQWNADVRRAVEEATRSAQDVVRDMDVRVLVDDAMQDLPDVAMLGGRPRIGVNTRDVTAEEAKAAGLNGITGAYVTNVPADSVAAKAGLQAKDIIVSVDGETIRSARHLARVITETPDGRALQIAYVRGTTRATATVTPEVRSMTLRRGPGDDGPVVRRFDRRMMPGLRGGDDTFDLVIPRGPGGDNEFFYRRGPEGGVRIWTGRGRLGVMAQSLTEQLATYFGVKDGVLVTQVSENSAAAKAGIKAGDVITAVNGKPVKDAGDIVDSLQGVEDGKSVPVEITRDRKPHTLTVTLETRSNTSGDRPAPRRQRFTA